MDKSDKTQAIDYRHGGVRYFGYSHIFGELFRSFISRQFLNASYAVTTAYVLTDAFSQCNKSSGNDYGREIGLKAGDVLLWHSGASVFIPSFIMYRVKWGTNYWLLKMGISRQLRLYIPVATGLLSIPIIIHPVDRLMDYLMDETYRKYID